MSDVTSSRDTVAIEESAHATYKQLTEGNDPINAPFRTMKDVFMWAAALGSRSGERRPLMGKRITIFRWSQFTTQIDIPLLRAISIADVGGVDVLLSQDRILPIAEEYANAGMRELNGILLDDAGQPFWNLVSILNNQRVAKDR